MYKTKIIGVFIFMCLMALSLFGAKLPDNSPTPLGGMQVSVFENGISLFQGYQGQYYTVSPFNDFYITPRGERFSFIPLDDIRQKNYHTSHKKNTLSYYAFTFLSYFIPQKPVQEFSSDTIRARYTATMNGNRATIRYAAELASKQARFSGITLTYSKASIIFDNAYQLFDYQSQNSIDDFSATFNIPLVTNSFDLQETVETNALIIVNPYYSQSFIVRAPANTTMVVNRNARLIEITRDISSPSHNLSGELYIETYSSPSEAINSL